MTWTLLALRLVDYARDRGSNVRLIIRDSERLAREDGSPVVYASHVRCVVSYVK